MAFTVSAAQLPLNFGAPAPSLANFIVGANAELVQRLQQRDFPTVLYLWGAPGCGKSHLLNSAASFGLPIIENAQDLNAEQQAYWFDVFNAARLNGGQLVVAADKPPLQLALREDLRTRLGSGLVYQVQPLSDEEKRAALHSAAQARGWVLDDSLSDYLLTHLARDMRSLMALLEALDRYSLATKRAVTLTLLKEILKS